MLMVIMSQSISCVSNMPDRCLRDTTIWTHWLSITSVCILNCMGVLWLIRFDYRLEQLIVSTAFALVVKHWMLHLIILETSKWHCSKSLFPLVNLARVDLLKVMSEISRADTMTMFYPHLWWWCFGPTNMMKLFEQLRVFLLPIGCVGRIRS